MAVAAASGLKSLGFFTVLEDEQLGLTGGYLILNHAGRPIEFHCTAPVRPNRAQQILYGPTLTPYLYGEQIGQALLLKASAEPLVVFIDLPVALCVRQFSKAPVVLVGDVERGEDLLEFSWGANRLLVPGFQLADREGALAALAELSQLDLSEPFTRIREAIEEAQRGRKADPPREAAA